MPRVNNYYQQGYWIAFTLLSVMLLIQWLLGNKQILDETLYM